MLEAISKIRGETITLATSQAFATSRGIPPGFNAVEIDAPSATLEAVTVAFGPKIKKVYFYDSSRDVYIDFTEEATNRNLLSLIDVGQFAWQTTDRLYVQFARRAAGIRINLTLFNGAGTATMGADYASVGPTWTAFSITDGTLSTRTLAQDGLYTWTQPANRLWTPQTLQHVGDGGAIPNYQDPGFWVRFQPSANLTDTSNNIVALSSLMNETLDTITGSSDGQSPIRITTNDGGSKVHRYHFDPDLYGSIELISASITTAANVNWLQV